MQPPLTDRLLGRVTLLGLAGWVAIVATALAYGYVTSTQRCDQQRLREFAQKRQEADSALRALDVSIPSHGKLAVPRTN
jgi:hypothetical protein